MVAKIRNEKLAGIIQQEKNVDADFITN